MRSGLNRLNLRPLLILSIVATWTESAVSASWSGTASVAPGLFYTDNVCLSKSNKRSDFTGIAILTPSGSVSGKSGKSSYNASGSVSINTLTNGDLRDDGCSGEDLEDRQRIFPRINATYKTELINNWVKLDARGRADQNQINSARARSTDGLDRNGNTNTFFRYSISPSLSRRVKNNAQYNLRYSFDDQINTADSVSNSNRHAVTTSLSNRYTQQISWNMSGRYSRVVYNDGVINRRTGLRVPRDDTELKSASLKMGYKFNRRWSINGTYGWEWNDFQTFNSANTGGNAWFIGMRWTPSPRTSVSLGSGDRFFGKTPRINISHRRKRSTFTGSYDKKITFRRDLTTQGFGTANGAGSFSDTGFSDGTEVVDEIDTVGGEDFINDDGTVSNTFSNSSINSNSAILDERVSIGYSYGGLRAAINVRGSYSQQTRAEDGAVAEFKDISVTVSPKLSSKYTLSGSIAWSEDEPIGFLGDPNRQDFETSEVWYFRLNYYRPLNSRMGFSLNYQFTDRQSDSALNEYQENSVRATVNIAL